MVTKKQVVKEVKVQHVRGLEYNCPKSLKMYRGSMSKEQFRQMILNDKKAQLSKKKIKKAD